jgi:nuclear transport factor 2 (NTF2) superfamily protein
MLPGSASTDDRDFIDELYAGFNAREIDRLLLLMEPDVAWPNGMDGGYETGRDAVRAYWTRQWMQIDPEVTPQKVDAAAGGRLAVRVRQVIRDPSGRVLRDGPVTHLYTLRGFRVVTMEIRAETD